MSGNRIFTLPPRGRMGLERYAKYCGPAVVAKVLNVSRLSAAKKLQTEGATGPGTSLLFMQQVMLRAGWKVRIEHVATGPRLKEAMAGEHGAKARRYGLTNTDYLPTLSQWRKDNKKAHAFVATTTHWVYVRNGRVLEHNGHPMARGRVTVVAHLTPPADHPYYSRLKAAKES